MKYRAEIDGLRALAVVPVILFHAGFELFSGGFVGVDVFFVISGYLITTILIEDIENKRFSIINFYERRARRIFPALFFVMLVCIPFAWIWMIPSQMKDFSQSLVAVSLFASNMLFWRESGYFAAAAEEKPLLHTWSLAVEEQYYVLFPIFLILTWRFGKSSVFWMIVVMATISLLLSELGWRNKPLSSFYLAPTRAWELFAGSIAAFIVQKKGIHKNNFLATLGLAAIVYSIFFYDETIPFPSVYALVPVLGVVLVILNADKETFAARLLSTKGFVGIGLISYSAYLWHQPLFAFAKIRSLEQPPLFLMSAFSLVTFVLAYLTWKYIESPFRFNKRGIITKKLVLCFSVVGLIGFSSFGLLGHFSDGFKSRVPKAIVEIEKAGQPVRKAPCFSGEFTNCLLGQGKNLEKFVLVGDSHAERYAYIFDKIAKEKDHNVRVISGSWCAPLVNWSVKKYSAAPNPKCFPFMEKEIHKLAQSNVDTIVLAARWGEYGQGYRHSLRSSDYVHSGVDNVIENTNIQPFRKALTDTVTFLMKNDKKVFIISPVPEYGFSVPIALAKAKLFDLDTSSLNLPLNNYREVNNEFFSTLESELFTKLSVLNVEGFFCGEDICLPYNEKYLPLYNDGNHLSEIGLRKVGSYLYSEIVGSDEGI